MKSYGFGFSVHKYCVCVGGCLYVCCAICVALAFTKNEDVCLLAQLGPFTFILHLSSPHIRYCREGRLSPASALKPSEISPWVGVKMSVLVGVSVAEAVVLIECLPQVHLWRPVPEKPPW